jgi:hypothetical protein
MDKIFCIQLDKQDCVFMVNHEQIEKIIKPDGNDLFIDFIFPSVTLRYREKNDVLNNLLNSVNLLLKTLSHQRECLSHCSVPLPISSSSHYRNYLNHLLCEDLNDLKIYQPPIEEEEEENNHGESEENLLKSIFSNKFPKEQELMKLREKLNEIQRQQEFKIIMKSLPK